MKFISGHSNVWIVKMILLFWAFYDIMYVAFGLSHGCR